jgi:hypothetical protein
MGRQLGEDRPAEEKWRIVLDGLKSSTLSEASRRYGIAQTLYNHWKDKGSKERRHQLGEKCCPSRNQEVSPHPANGAVARTEIVGYRYPKKRRGEVSCGKLHSKPRASLALAKSIAAAPRRQTFLKSIRSSLMCSITSTVVFCDHTLS